MNHKKGLLELGWAGSDPFDEAQPGLEFEPIPVQNTEPNQ